MPDDIDHESSDLLYHAKLAEKASRFEEMADIMKKLVEKKAGPLSFEERNLFAIAFKNLVGMRRASWRRICEEENREKEWLANLRRKGISSKQTSKQSSGASTPIPPPPAVSFSTPSSDMSELSRVERSLVICQEYRNALQRELGALVASVIDLVQGRLLGAISSHLANVTMQSFSTKQRGGGQASSGTLEDEVRTHLRELESKTHCLSSLTQSDSAVFYLKMLGDYRRFLAELSYGVDQEHRRDVLQALAAYLIASEVAKMHLPPTHPVRLGLALNLGHLYVEILAQPERACQTAKHAFDEAIAELDSAATDKFKDSLQIMQLLRENLTRWSSIE